MSITKKTSLKQEAHQLIEQLPDNCSMDDIHYQLYLMDKIKRSEESLRCKGGIPHEEVRKRFAKWRSK